jgi:hypothetical protein
MTLGSLNISNMAVSSNLSVGNNLYVGGSVVSVNITTLNIIDNNISTGTFNATAATIGTLNGTLFTAGSIGAAGATVGTLYATALTGTSATIGTVLSTLASAGSIGAAGATVGTLYVSTVTAANAQLSGTISAGTHVGSLVSAGSMGASGITTGTLYSTNANATNASIGTLNVSSGLTTGNINFTGSLYQNGVLYVSSQWTSTNGNLFYTSGNIGIYNTAPAYALDVSGGANITGVVSAGTLVGSLVSAASMGVSGATVGTLYSSYIKATSASAGTVVATLMTSGSIGASGITTGTLYATSLTGTSATIGTILSTLVSSASVGVSGATVGTLYVSSITSGNMSSLNATIASVVSTSITTSNIHTGAGSLGPSIMLQYKFIDVTTGSYTSYTASNTIVFTEDGNPGLNGSIGYSSGFGTLSDGSSDNISWNRARLIMRGVSLNTGTSGSTVVIQPFAVQSSTGTLYTQSSFTVTDSGSLRGYTTWISPWFNTNIVSDIQSLGIKVLSLNGSTGGNVRIGSTYLQFTA